MHVAKDQSDSTKRVFNLEISETFWAANTENTLPQKLFGQLTFRTHQRAVNSNAFYYIRAILMIIAQMLMNLIALSSLFLIIVNKHSRNA